MTLFGASASSAGVRTNDGFAGANQSIGQLTAVVRNAPKPDTPTGTITRPDSTLTGPSQFTVGGYLQQFAQHDRFRDRVASREAAERFVTT
jgi:hypothetical protein